jgi:hypothetical protein
VAIQVPPDSTGKTVRTKTDAGTQEQQVVTLGNGSDTNIAALSDMDTGAGTELALNVSLRKSASGGSAELFTASNPGRIDPNGTTIQPVSGTVATSNFPATVDTNSGVKSANTVRVVIATDQPALTNKLLVTPDSVALPANQSVNAAQLAGTTTDTNSGNKSAGTLRVVIATDQPALTNKLLVTADAVNQAGTWTVQPGNTANTTPWLTTQIPATSGGLSIATGSIAATKTDVKTSAGQVYGWYIYNPNASVAYVQFFNATAANVTLGSTGPVYSIGIPATSAANVEFGNGIAHGTAISIAVTTTRAGSTGTGSTVDFNIYYK